jgi:DNA-binding winged helix-turn-helix (wHTH) protein
MSSYRFGDFTVDGDTRQLLRAGAAVHLSPKAFLLLKTLLDAAPRAVSKADLQDRLWPNTIGMVSMVVGIAAEAPSTDTAVLDSA